MDRLKRNERLGAMARMLTATPNRIYTLSHFADLFGAAKSTVSEDVAILADTFRQFDQGQLITVAGAAGGVIYRPIPSPERARQTIAAIAEKLSQPGRLLPGDFLYTTDVTCDSLLSEAMGEILAAKYYDLAPHFVLTMETKGIPVAMMTARSLNVPLVIARRDSRAYEGSAVNVNYIDASGRVETMCLARRAVKSGQRALIIDDFTKGGGTLRGMHDLMAEFEVDVVGTGVVVATAQPQKKRIGGVNSLMILQSVDEETASAKVVPSPWINE